MDWIPFFHKYYFNFILVKFMFIYVSIYLYMSVIITLQRCGNFILLILLFQINVCHTKLLFILKECMNASIYKKHITNTTNTCSLTSYNVNAIKIMCFFSSFVKWDKKKINRKLIQTIQTTISCLLLFASKNLLFYFYLATLSFLNCDIFV